MPEERSTIRIEPRNIDAETACLGSMLLDKSAILSALEQLKKEDFYLDKNQIIFDGILELSRSTESGIDIVTLTNHLRGNKLLEKSGGVEYLNSLIETVPSSANIEYYIKIVKDKSLLRNLIGSARKIIDQSFDESLDINMIIDEAEKDIFQITQRETKVTFESAKDILLRAVQKITEHDSSKITGLSTGYKRLDEITDGFHEAELIIIAARPSMGKTAFAMNIAENMALREKIGVAVFSLEMSKDQLAIRMLSSHSRINGRKIMKGFITDEERQRMMDAADSLSDSRIFIDDMSALTVFDIRSKLRRLMSEHKIQIVFIDYLQLMQHYAYKDNRQQQIAEISRSLKLLAKELNIPIVALSQLNRRIDDRKDRQPQLSDLRESGAIEQDADLVIFIHREEVYDKEKTKPEKKGKADIIIGKNRFGAIDTFELNFVGEFTQFAEQDEYHEAGE